MDVLLGLSIRNIIVQNYGAGTFQLLFIDLYLIFRRTAIEDFEGEVLAINGQGLGLVL